MSTEQRPTLTVPSGMGGVIAQDGFDYQLWQGLVRVPSWLKNPAFEQVIFEGLEDVEAKFFSPHAPRGLLLERYQAKSGDLDGHEVRKVFEAFLTFERAYPRAARLHTLVTPRLPSSLQWLARDANRVRRARPFYAPFADMMQASDEQFRSDCIKQFGDALGPFVAQNVEVDQRLLQGRDHAIQAFGLELARSFPQLSASRQLEAMFGKLSELGRKSSGAPIGRNALIKALEAELGQPLISNSGVAVHVRSDRNESSEGAIEIDASAFSGGPLRFPETERWTNELVAPLVTTAKWLRATDALRVRISGSYRLTTAFVLGWCFRSAVGFELVIPTRAGAWATDDRPGPIEAETGWATAEPDKLDGERLVVAVGILRRPGDDLAGGIVQSALLSASLDRPIVSAKEAQAAVTIVKSAVAAACSRLGPKRVDLYYAGPAAFAVALGHRWNALPPTQLYEFVAAERRYVPTAFVG